jgi:hypothetical protein
VRAQAADLDDALAETRSQIGLMELKLRRTRLRGVFRHGARYIVPYYDEVGLAHRTRTRDQTCGSPRMRE